MKYDKNKDGKITSADALAYSKTAAGKIAQRQADRAAAGPSKGQQQQAAMAAKAEERKANMAARQAAAKERNAAAKAAMKARSAPVTKQMATPGQPSRSTRLMAKGGLSMAKKGKK
jgi:hypothetical protein